MKNVSKLRAELSTVFEQLKNNELDIQQAKAIVATSNAMLKSAQLEMEHSKMTGSGKSIIFLSTD
jgi:microcompartment protein CcmL/EutN|tara:strand:+ start:236 stop:430 length:195 start_codon:yes stop_codon:yes gene_type:complete